MNRIVVLSGANSALVTIRSRRRFMCYPDAVYIQFEIPFAAAAPATSFAEKQGIPYSSTPAGECRYAAL